VDAGANMDFIAVMAITDHITDRVTKDLALTAAVHLVLVAFVDSLLGLVRPARLVPMPLRPVSVQELPLSAQCCIACLEGVVVAVGATRMG
jgi:hypothetical protein